MLLPLLFIFLFAYCLLLLLTRSFDREDIEMILAIEKKTGVDAEPIKRLLRRFI
jgi:hypothetical protein